MGVPDATRSPTFDRPPRTTRARLTPRRDRSRKEALAASAASSVQAAPTFDTRYVIETVLKHIIDNITTEASGGMNG